ncbi:MAG: sterol desaturase family protein [Deltaproteobacteria bacterium]|nr:sterol desaturase family protein [Deltaproteobacteria bacterium]MBW1874558.1 sterol desaturase family protein [Deltaproteobacteria bacterium]MBW2209940.1 sterol desaturase family protein [Deltaproteobacteria bacterium]MBW2213005.1 sterol desaturase family protein [Deltaproteobacteria bacterium]MBW2550079.1 sterol desaturase family protein [Deltaproteobacteria bacterium]
MKVLFVILASYTSAGLAIALLLYAYRSTAAQQYLISDDPHRSTGDRELYWRVALNTTVSITLIFAVMYGLGTYLYYDHAAPAWRYLLEAATVILIYDFGYYFVHRYPFHEWKILRGVHSVHHASRNPRVIDSLLLHPVETILGLGLFFGSVALVGGVHIYTLGVLFTTYTAFNILNHAGVDVPHFPLKTLGVLAAKHDRHHHSMLSGNYASITPLPDIIFGTVE